MSRLERPADTIVHDLAIPGLLYCALAHIVCDVWVGLSRLAFDFSFCLGHFDEAEEGGSKNSRGLSNPNGSENEFADVATGGQQWSKGRLITTTVYMPLDGGLCVVHA